LNAIFPGLKMWDTFACATAKKITYFIISIAELENVPPDAGVQKRATFFTLIVGLAGTGNRIRATCEASSSTNRSAIHYAMNLSVLLEGIFYMRVSAGQFQSKQLILIPCAKYRRLTYERS
jgi:hypothetical protein